MFERLNLFKKGEKSPFRSCCLETNLKNKKFFRLLYFIYKSHYISTGGGHCDKNKRHLGIFLSCGLGDYLLFRPFLEYIRSFYKDYKITLIGEKTYKDFALAFDSRYFDEFVYFNKVFGFNSFALKDECFDVLISPFNNLFSSVIKNILCIEAKEKIGFFPAHCSQTLNLKSFSKVVYSNKAFRSLAYQDYFEQLFDKKLDFKLEIKLNETKFSKINFDFSQKYALIFPGGSNKNKRWSALNFAKVCEHLYQKYDLVSFVAGTKNESALAHTICLNQPFVKNICAKFSLEELVYIINGAQIVLANDSAGYHLAMNSACENVICISPKDWSFDANVNYPSGFYPSKTVSIALPATKEEGLNECLNKISPAKVCALIDENHFNT